MPRWSRVSLTVWGPIEQGVLGQGSRWGHWVGRALLLVCLQMWGQAAQFFQFWQPIPLRVFQSFVPGREGRDSKAKNSFVGSTGSAFYKALRNLLMFISSARFQSEKPLLIHTAPSITQTSARNSCRQFTESSAPSSIPLILRSPLAIPRTPARISPELQCVFPALCLKAFRAACCSALTAWSTSAMPNRCYIK